VVGRKEAVRIFELLPLQEFAARQKPLSVFAKGLQEFYEGRFSVALESFLAMEKTDPPAAAYARKCRALIDHPPEYWEGVWTMTEK
jgi:adenylate cyclase